MATIPYWRGDLDPAEIASGSASTSPIIFGTLVQIQLDGGRNSATPPRRDLWFHVPKSVPGLELVEVHPSDWWHKERALIKAEIDPRVRKLVGILARFSDDEKDSLDFLAMIEVLGSQKPPRCSLMVASRKTSLKETASDSVAWLDKVRGHQCANNGYSNLRVELETLQPVSSPPRFVIRPQSQCLSPRLSPSTRQLSSRCLG